MIEVGRLCIKTAGRDAMQYCVVVEVIDEKFVLVDGNTRRKKVNLAHIEPLDSTFKIKKGATTKDVQAELEKAGLPVKIKGKARTPKTQTKKTVDKKDSKKKSTTKKETKKE